MEEQRTENTELQNETTEWENETAAQHSEAAEQENNMKKQKIKRKKKSGFHFTGSTVAKVIAFLILGISVLAGTAAAAGCYFAVEEEVYTSTKDTVLKNAMKGRAYRVAYTVKDFMDMDDEEGAKVYLEDIHAEVAVFKARGDNSCLWKSYEAKACSDWYYDITVYVSSSVFGEGEANYDYIFRVFFDWAFPISDDIRYEYVSLVYDLRFWIIGILAGSVLTGILSFVFLLCSAGHRNGREGIVPGVLTNLHFDVLTSAVCVAIYGAWEFFHEISNGGLEGAICFITAGIFTGVLGMLYLMDFAIRLKLGKWWQHTLIYVMLRTLWRTLKALGRLFFKIPLVWKTVVIYLGVVIAEVFLILCLMGDRGAYIPLCLMEKIALFPLVLYLALVCRKLKLAGKELANGNENYRVDTKYMVGAFKEHGECLNSVGQGISKAVEGRMRSERMKTELITNVSHDLKTPLTSIINYADLICQEKTENPNVNEYSEVLLRQSRRLKKLLDDLVEASKATTGNLEVNLAPCEVGVLLTQAVGEYQQRMEEKELELRTSQPELPVKILADGRHLWRVFDNLMNNICKYTQEKSRVYLSVEKKEGKVYVTFKNMSKYALEISPEELEERFVRGDKSRHMEGSGLGLSIAKSLTELQKGQMDIFIDGDLFKVVLTFDALSE